MKEISQILLVITIFIYGYVTTFAINGCTEKIIKNARLPVYSLDGKSFAYTKYFDSKGSDGWYVIKDEVDGHGWYPIAHGKKWMVFSNIHELVLSPDGKSYAYNAVRETGYNQYEFVIIKDGIEIDNGYSPIYSPDGKSFAYINDGNSVVKDGIKGKQYSGIIKNLTYSPDGKSFAYKIETDWGWLVVRDGIESKIYGDIETIVYSPDGKSLSFAAEQYGKWFIVKDEIENKKYDQTMYPVYSPDGKSFAYIAKDGGKWFIVKDGIEGERYDSVKNPAYSPDGKSFAYIAENLKRNESTSKEFIVKDGIEGERYYGEIEYFAYSPDGRKILSQLRLFSGGGEYLMINGVRITESSLESNFSPNKGNFFFSPDGKEVVYMAFIEGVSAVIRQRCNDEITGIKAYITIPDTKEKTKEELIKEKAKVYEDKIDKIIGNIPMFIDKIEKIHLFNKALSAPKYKNNPVVQELLEYLKSIESKIDENLNINTFFGY